MDLGEGSRGRMWAEEAAGARLGGGGVEEKEEEGEVVVGGRVPVENLGLVLVPPIHSKTSGSGGSCC